MTSEIPTSVRILIVEDEALIAAELADRLQRRNFTTVGPVDNAADAVACVERERPDLVLMDVRLKGEHDGIWAASRIHEQFGTPVLFLTANADIATYRRAQSAMPYGYVVKPFSERELVVAVDTALIRARAERALRNESLTYATIASAVADAVIVTDSDGNVRYLNPSAERLTGWSWVEVAGRQRAAVMPFVASAPTSFDTGGRFERQNGTMVTREGRSFAVVERRAPVIDAAGREIGIVSSITDAEELALLRSEIATVEALSDAVFTASPVAMALLDHDGTVHRMNPAFQRLSGIPRSALPIQASVLLSDTDYRPFESQLAALAPRQPGKPTEVTLRRPDDTVASALSNLVTIPTPAGTSTGKVLWQCLPIDAQKRLIAAAMSQHADHAVVTRGTLPSSTVLVVEDDPVLRQIISRMLERAGAMVESVVNGREALVRIRERTPAFDLVLTDIVMPEMTGGELAQQLETWHPALPIVFMSGYHEDTLVHHAVDSGVRRLIHKPFTQDELLDALREVLTISRESDASH